MKKNFFKIRNICFVLAIFLATVFVSCRKYNSLGFTPGNGAPSITSVHTWSKTDTSTHYDTVITYNDSGTITRTLKARSNLPYAFDSATTAGTLGNYYIIYGSNLGSATNITFNGYTAYFNRALIKDNSIIVQVPSKTPYLGSQASDSLVVTTLHGQAYYKFAILPPAPSPASYSNYNYYGGSQITLSGIGFATVTSVTLAGEGGQTGTTSIVNQNDSVMTLRFDSSLVTQGTLVFNYDAAGVATKANATQVLVNLDNAYQFFTDDFRNGWSDGSWQAPSGKTTAAFKTGTASFMGTFTANGWKIEGLANWYPSLPYDASYKYLSFWVKGGTVSHILNIETNTSSAGYGQNSVNPITVPPTVWTYFKIPLGSIDFWKPGSTLQQIGFFLKGQGSDVNETYYFDDIILIK